MSIEQTKIDCNDDESGNVKPGRIRRILKFWIFFAQFWAPGVLFSCRHREGMDMRYLISNFSLAACLVALPAVTSAKGCLKGAAVGAVAGHVAGHHAVVGSAAGCVIEHHREKNKAKATPQKEQGNPR